jgi:biopolymer transport protein ExbB
MRIATTFQGPQTEGGVVGTIGEFFEAGGMLMWPILGCSVVAVGLAIERYTTLRRERVAPAIVADAVDQIVQGRASVVAGDVAQIDAPAARVLAAGLRRRGCLLADVEKAMEDSLGAETAQMRGNVRGITLMAAVAPLLGLLGTVLGIADAFAAVERTGLGRGENSEALAAGIKVALYTTIFGLFVAIPATLVAAHLQARVRRLGALVAAIVAPAVEALARGGASDGGETDAA